MEGEQYSGPTTTANSQSEGRLRVDVGGQKKNKMKLIKKHISQAKSANDIIKRDNLY